MAATTEPDNPPLGAVPLFPNDLLEAMRERGAHSAPDGERPGVMGPINGRYGWMETKPALFVEIAFYPQGELPEIVEPRNWEKLRVGAKWSFLEELAAADVEPSSGYVLEFGPTLVLRNREIPFEMVVPEPPIEWEEAVHKAGGALVVIGSGLAVAAGDGDAVVAPVEAAGLIARDGGSYPAPHLTEIPGLHVMPLTLHEYHEGRPYSFILDTDVLIGIERFFLAPQPTKERERIRQLLVNLAYRDIVPGPALSQVYQHGRAGFDVTRATRAAAAIQAVMGWDRAGIISYSGPGVLASGVTGHTYVPTSVDPRMMMLYAGMLRLRREWSPGASLAVRARAFERILEWLLNDLQVAAPFLVQVALNLLVADDHTHLQASRLLHFHNAPASAKTLDELWATAFDVYLVSSHAVMISEPTMGEPVLLTFDKGLAGLYDLARYVGMVPVPGEAGENGEHWFIVGTKLNLHPRLAHLKPRVEEWYERARDDMMERHVQGRDILERGPEFASIAEREERLLLASYE